MGCSYKHNIPDRITKKMGVYRSKPCPRMKVSPRRLRKGISEQELLSHIDRAGQPIYSHESSTEWKLSNVRLLLSWSCSMELNAQLPIAGNTQRMYEPPMSVIKIHNFYEEILLRWLNSKTVKRDSSITDCIFAKSKKASAKIQLLIHRTNNSIKTVLAL